MDQRRLDLQDALHRQEALAILQCHPLLFTVGNLRAELGTNSSRLQALPYGQEWKCHSSDELRAFVHVFIVDRERQNGVNVLHGDDERLVPNGIECFVDRVRAQPRGVELDDAERIRLAVHVFGAEIARLVD